MKEDMYLGYRWQFGRLGGFPRRRLGCGSVQARLGLGS